MSRNKFELDLLQGIQKKTNVPEYKDVLSKLSDNSLVKLVDYLRENRPILLNDVPFYDEIEKELNYYNEHGKRIDQ